MPEDPSQQPTQPTVPVQPVVPQPMPAPSPVPSVTPTPQVFGLQPAMPAVPFTPAMPVPVLTAKKSRLPLVLALVGGGIVMLLVLGGIIAYTVIASSTISPTNIQSAETAAHALSSDINTIFDTADKMSSENSQTQVSADAKLIGSTLADAQKQYATLKVSKVEHNASVHIAFDSFATKWPPFTSYMADSVSDVQTLAPALFSFESQINTLDQDQPTTTAQLDIYLTNYKGAIDTTSQKLANVHMKTPEDIQTLSAFQTLLQSSSKDVAQAQSDLNSGQNGSTVEDDLLNVDDAETTFQDAENNADDQVDTHIQQLDPTSQFATFESVLDTLNVKSN